MRFLLFLPALLLLAGTAPAEDEGRWSGEWVTDRGRMVLEQKGDEVSGEYGEGGTIDGTVKGSKLTFSWARGRGSGDGTFELAESGGFFEGKWRTRGGGGSWRGWKKDPEATEGEPADFGGAWLSSLGTMILEQKGAKVEGTYGSQGWGTVKGTVKGRRLSLTWKRIRWSGRAWLEMTEDGKRFYGLTEEETPAKWLGVRIDDFAMDPEPEAGEIVKGLTENGICYFLRAPDRWRKGKKTDAIILLHVSNWTTKGMTPVTARNWPELGKRYMIVGIQGEQWADWSDPPDLRHNYTYVNWVGRSTYEGYPYTDRESPYLVHEMVKDLKEEHDLGRIFVVGHSQGGFLAYYLHMHYPETFAGVAPLSCSLTFQCEPDAFDDEELMAAQRATPLAMVHGTRDRNWGPKTGDYVFDRFAASGFPKLRYFRPDAGHAYDFLPIGEVMAWLDAMAAVDAKPLRKFAKEAAEAERWRDVAAALVRAEEIGAARRLKPFAEKLEAAAAEEREAHLAAIEANEDGAWVDGFLAWRDRFEFAPGSGEVMEAYGKLRKKHDGPAEKLIGEARKAFRAGDREGGYAKWEEIVGKYYACGKYRVVVRWLEQAGRGERGKK